MTARTPIILDCCQRSSEWFTARLGIPTASGFAKIVTAKGEPRKGVTPTRYLEELVYERITGVPSDKAQTYAMRRGTELEPHARAWYELATGRKVDRVGFVYGDASRAWGCSPDGRVKGSGGVEIKCPTRANFVGPMNSGIPEDWLIQAQGEMWVCGADWWDLVVYTEENEKPVGYTARLEADAKLHAGFDKYVPEFADEVAGAAEHARSTLSLYRGVTLQMLEDALGPEWVRFGGDGDNVSMEGLEL